MKETMKYLALIFWMLFTILLGIPVLPLIVSADYGWFKIPDKILKS
jgi:hypothetical protein